MRRAASGLRLLAAGLLGVGLLTAAQAQDRLAPQMDSDQPIEINADTLEVQQDKNLAIFKGNVEATQGRIKLQANEIKVWYQPGGSEDRKAGDSADAGGTIERIDAIGKVFVSSPEETAQGNQGVYDVPGKRITLTGEVVLTRGENVIRGEKLVLNMATGRSEIVGGKDRVKGIFVPPKKEGKE